MIQKKLQEIKGTSSQNLYDHLKKVLSSLLLKHPKDGFRLFEQYSFNLKSPQERQLVHKVRQSYALLKEYDQSNKTLLKKLNAGTEEDPVEPASIAYVPNVMEENRLFEKIGVGVGEDEAYRVYKSLAVLASKKSPDYLKFWGKILGNQSYYVAEGVLKGDSEEGLAPNVELRGTGVNTLSYWVTTSLSKDWVELPTVTPEQLKVSRRIKYVFKGDPNAKIVSNPSFPGTQAHLLKCQIVRITSGSVIAPKGQFLKDPENDRKINPYQPVAPEQQGYIKPLQFSDLRSLGNWVHHPESILKNGIVEHFVPEGIEQGGEEQEKYRKQQKIKDPFEPRLKPLTEDQQTRGWKIGTYGQNNTYRALGASTTPVNYGIIYLKNLNWPGWSTIYYLGNVTNIYVGYGFKAGQIFSPCEPDNILKEREDSMEAQDE